MSKSIKTQKDLLFPSILWERPQNIYSRARGKILILAGHKGSTRPALLIAETIWQMGAYEIVLGYPQILRDAYKQILPADMHLSLPATPQGTVSKKALDKIIKASEDCHLVIFSPDLSRQIETNELVGQLIEKLDKPLIISAETIFNLSLIRKDLGEIFTQRQKPAVVILRSPRLAGFVEEELNPDNQLKLLRETAQQTKSVLVFCDQKETLIINPEGEIVRDEVVISEEEIFLGIATIMAAQNPDRLFESIATATFLYQQLVNKDKSLSPQEMINNIRNTVKKLEASKGF